MRRGKTVRDTWAVNARVAHQRSWPRGKCLTPCSILVFAFLASFPGQALASQISVDCPGTSRSENRNSYRTFPSKYTSRTLYLVFDTSDKTVSIKDGNNSPSMYPFEFTQNTVSFCRDVCGTRLDTDPDGEPVELYAPKINVDLTTGDIEVVTGMQGQPDAKGEYFRMQSRFKGQCNVAALGRLARELRASVTVTPSARSEVERRSVANNLAGSDDDRGNSPGKETGKTEPRTRLWWWQCNASHGGSKITYWSAISSVEMSINGYAKDHGDIKRRNQAGFLDYLRNVALGPVPTSAGCWESASLEEAKSKEEEGFRFGRLQDRKPQETAYNPK